jgi:hypothetical protein
MVGPTQPIKKGGTDLLGHYWPNPTRLGSAQSNLYLYNNNIIILYYIIKKYEKVQRVISKYL